MGEHFQQETRHGGGAGFTVRAVPGLAAGPGRFELRPDVVDHLGLDGIGEGAPVEAAFPVGEPVAAFT